MKAVADNIPQLVQGMRSSHVQPEELGAQLTLIMASQTFLQVRPNTVNQWSQSRHKSYFFLIFFSLEVRWWHLLSQLFQL